MSNTITYSIDRIDEEVAVLVDDAGYSYPIPLEDLPNGVKSGDIIRCVDGRYECAPTETAERRSYVLSLQEKLRKKSQ